MATLEEFAIIAVTAAALLALLTWLWWKVPKWQLNSLTPKIPTKNPKERADVEDNFRKTFSQALAGATVLIGAGFTLFQFLEQQRASQEQFLQQQKAAHDLLISSQVSKGFEQLASDKLAMRLGGIYALEGVMNTSEQYRVSVLEALCAFVRVSTIELTTATEPAQPVADIQAVLMVIGRRAIGPGLLDLARTRIPGADLHDANLSGANLTGADLHDADLHGANLTGAHLDGQISVNLGGANLTGADLHDADLHGANLREANLSSAKLTGANLTAAQLTGADLTGADLTDVRVDDQTCGANLRLGNLTLKPCPDLPSKIP